MTSEMVVEKDAKGRTVRATILKLNCPKKVFQFMPAPRPAQGPAAKWLQKHHPIECAVSDCVADLVGGGTVAVQGCTIADLYPLPEKADSEISLFSVGPRPLPTKTALRKMAPSALRSLCEGRGLPVIGMRSKAKLIEMLLAH